MPAWKDRRRAQAGTTLIELLVSLVIVGLALVLVVGTFSTGLLDATLAKRNTAVEAVIQYELDTISAAQFSTSAQSYSECFATESPVAPSPAPPSPGSCSSAYALRADVTWAPGSPGTQTQLWTVSVISNGGGPVGNSVAVIKANR